MVVECDIFKLEFLLVTVLVDECGVKLSLPFRPEALDLDLLGEIHPVGRKSFESGFLGAPVDRQLLVPLVVVKVLKLALGKSLALHGGEVSGQGFDVDPDILVVVENDGHILVRVRDAYVGYAVLKIRLAVVVMAEINLFAEQFTKECPYRQPLLAERLIADERNLLHLIGRDRGQLAEFFFRFGYLPDPDQGSGFFQFFFKI